MLTLFPFFNEIVIEAIQKENESILTLYVNSIQFKPIIIIYTPQGDGLSPVLFTIYLEHALK